ncbi:hypothetical protein BJ138DRAFT_1104486 [Hygrophoropsis aurantiaca]|uniref:Uncharacterized protein n=1 Tax=Hygrophoropsis aurantiaca TaxID=72124 RepID=A0ACB8A118_9AGAM|nr:hypothetical protein BJ138DRAFT_1104486 [Hygrophoropsis aurantiaca]
MFYAGACNGMPVRAIFQVFGVTRSQAQAISQITPTTITMFSRLTIFKINTPTGFKFARLGCLLTVFHAPAQNPWIPGLKLLDFRISSASPNCYSRVQQQTSIVGRGTVLRFSQVRLRDDDCDANTTSAPCTSHASERWKTGWQHFSSSSIPTYFELEFLRRRQDSHGILPGQTIDPAQRYNGQFDGSPIRLGKFLRWQAGNTDVEYLAQYYPPLFCPACADSRRAMAREKERDRIYEYEPHWFRKHKLKPATAPHAYSATSSLLHGASIVGIGASSLCWRSYTNFKLTVANQRDSLDPEGEELDC